MKTQTDRKRLKSRAATFASFVVWCVVAILVASLWYLLNNVEPPRAIVDKTSASALRFWGGAVEIVLTAVLYLIALLGMAKLGKALKMSRVIWFSFVAGHAVVIMLWIVWWILWRLPSSGGTSVGASAFLGWFSDLTICLFPSSILFMDADPSAPFLERTSLYATAMLLNGVLYAIVVAVILRLLRAVKK
jgi:hypothetical protein